MLGNLRGKNPERFRRLNERLRYVFPQLEEVSIRSVSGNAYTSEVIVYEERSENHLDAISLADSGTGIGQALAMLYFLVTARDPRAIVIDEPQSFLHPGALRKLLEIFHFYPQHQYVIATHSPAVVGACRPSTITLLTKSRGDETRFHSIDIGETDHLRLCLRSIGARLSDVFGADAILWVEGPTEVECFALIFAALSKKPLCGAEFVPVMGPDEVVGKNAERIIGIHSRLSEGKGLLPPALGFIFDRECRGDDKVRDLERQLRGRVKFLPRRMFENYLLNPEAIAAVIHAILAVKAQTVTALEGNLSRFYNALTRTLAQNRLPMRGSPVCRWRSWLMTNWTCRGIFRARQS